VCASTGGNPYSTDNIDEHFVDKLKKGYRLDKPTYASDDMYASTHLKVSPYSIPFFKTMSAV